MFALPLTDFDATQWRSGATDWEGWAGRGGYPDALAQGERAARDEWFSGYVDTYLERDLRQLANIAHLPDFKRLMRLLASRSARLLNQSDLARDVQIPGATAHRYLNLLETGHLIARLPNYRASVSSSLGKARKILWGDVGLALWLAGVDASTVRSRPDCGFWLEQLVYQTLQTWAVLAPRRTISFWRDGAAEVDFVLEQNGQLVALEIKSSPMVSQDDLRGLRAFQANFAKSGQAAPLGVVLHPGTTALSHGGNVWSLPLHLFAPAG
jgi:predicted AAA+ superfamily ATPase